MRVQTMTIAVVVVAACESGDAGDTSELCSTMSMAVTQARGSCRMAADKSSPDGCPGVKNAYCGNEANCPAGWARSCESGSNCTYGGTCSSTGADTVEFDFFQTLDGVRGLAVFGQSGRCTFVPCL